MFFQRCLILAPNSNVSRGLKFINTPLTLLFVLTASDSVLQFEFVILSDCLWVFSTSLKRSLFSLHCCLFSSAPLSHRQANEQLVGSVLSISEAEVFGTVTGQTADRNIARFCSIPYLQSVSKGKGL